MRFARLSTQQRLCFRAFTLIELLIVVAIMAVLAATIIPQFSSSAQDAKVSAVKFDLNSLRTQISLYQVHHAGQLPQISNGTLPQLTSYTDANGNLGARGAAYPFGPYMADGIPPNPLTGSAVVTLCTTFPPTAASGNGGWLYNPSTGQIAADSAPYLNY